MSDPFFHVNAVAQCPHPAGFVSVMSSSSRVKVSGNAVATMGDTFSIAGCLHTIPTNVPSFCTKLVFLKPATRVKVGGQFAILKTSQGQCQTSAQVPQGAPTMVNVQKRAKGT
jgi:hypothetical protein